MTADPNTMRIRTSELPGVVRETLRHELKQRSAGDLRDHMVVALHHDDIHAIANNIVQAIYGQEVQDE